MDYFLSTITAQAFIYINSAFEDLWKRRVKEVMANPAYLLETIYPEDLDYVEDNYHQFLKDR